MGSIWEPQSKLYLGVHFGLNSLGCSTFLWTVWKMPCIMKLQVLETHQAPLTGVMVSAVPSLAKDQSKEANSKALKSCNTTSQFQPMKRMRKWIASQCKFKSGGLIWSDCNLKMTKVNEAGVHLNTANHGWSWLMSNGHNDMCNDTDPVEHDSSKKPGSICIGKWPGVGSIRKCPRLENLSQCLPESIQILVESRESNKTWHFHKLRIGFTSQERPHNPSYHPSCLQLPGFQPRDGKNVWLHLVSKKISPKKYQELQRRHRRFSGSWL